MKAAVFHHQHDVRVDNLSDPETRPRSVKIKICS
jgi:hypothetical protein